MLTDMTYRIDSRVKKIRKQSPRRPYSISRPRNDAELRNCLRRDFGIAFPDVQVCPNHSTPWRAFCDAFFCRKSIVVWKASRGFGGKSFMLSVLGTVEAHYLGAYVTILGGSGEQSARVHRYIREHRRKLDLPEDEATKRESSFGERGLVQALMASSRSVRGPHPQRLRLDEVDEMHPDLFEAALGQPMATRDIGKQTVISSTHHYSNRTMTLALARAQERGWPIHEWCYRETMEPHGWLLETEIASKRGEVSTRNWETEYDMQKPVLGGLVYPEFGPANLTHEEPSPFLPIEIAVDDGYNDPRAILFIQRRGDSVLVFDELYHRHHLSETCVQEIITRCEAWPWPSEDRDQLLSERSRIKPELAIGSPEAKELQQRFRRADIPYRFQPHKIVEGVERVRRMICNSKGYRTLRVHPRCSNLVREFGEYQYAGTQAQADENPQDGNDHALDALRYWLWMRMPQ